MIGFKKFNRIHNFRKIAQLIAACNSSNKTVLLFGKILPKRIASSNKKKPNVYGK
jgi:hypothetical protein